MQQRGMPEDADEFLDRVDEITTRVENILKGDVDVIAEEERFNEEMRLKEVKKEIKERERKELISKGRPGKGYKGEFKTFCLGCHTEYHHEAVEICNNCGKETIPKEVSCVLNWQTRARPGQETSGTFLLMNFDLI